jgi:hypothetical protein
MDLLKCRLLLHNPGFYKEYIIVFTVVPGVPMTWRTDEHGPWGFKGPTL